MENPISLLMSTKNLFESFKIIICKSEVAQKITLIITLSLYLSMGISIFFYSPISNYLHFKICYISCGIYFLIGLYFLDVILIEFDLRKKYNLNNYKSYNWSLTILELVNDKFNTKSETENFRDKDLGISKEQEDIPLIKNDLMESKKNLEYFIKNEFEPIRHLLKKSVNRITKIEKHIFPKEKIKINCSTEEIKSLFWEYKQDLFQNLDVNNFIKYMFQKESKISENILYEDEINNILAIMTLLIQEGRIKKNSKSVLYRLAKPYLKLGIELQMFGINIKNKKYRLTDEKNQSDIIKQITNFKII